MIKSNKKTGSLTGACFYDVMNEQSLFVFTVSLQNRYFLTKGISQ